MKLRNALLVGLLLIPGIAKAADVQLSWNVGGGIATRYRVHYGVTSAVYTGIVDVGNVLNATVPNLTPGTKYFFSVKAYNDTEESGFSNEISHTIVQPTLLAPRDLRVTQPITINIIGAAPEVESTPQLPYGVPSAPKPEGK